MESCKTCSSWRLCSPEMMFLLIIDYIYRLSWTVFCVQKKNLKVNSSVTICDVCSQIVDKRIHEIEQQKIRRGAALMRQAETLLTSEDDRTHRVLQRMKPSTYNRLPHVPEDRGRWPTGDSCISDDTEMWDSGISDDQLYSFPRMRPSRIPTLKTSGEGICHLFCYLNMCTSDLGTCS